jgi:hypothetical protein
MKSFLRGMATMLLLVALCASACDVKVYGTTVWRGWVGKIADALHEAHGGESHD